MVLVRFGFLVNLHIVWAFSLIEGLIELTEGHGHTQIFERRAQQEVKDPRGDVVNLREAADLPNLNGDLWYLARMLLANVEHNDNPQHDRMPAFIIAIQWKEVRHGLGALSSLHQIDELHFSRQILEWAVVYADAVFRESYLLPLE